MYEPNKNPNQGFIKLYRQVQDNWMWLSEPFTRGQAWIDLLMIANHKPNSFFIRGNRVDVGRGQIGWSKENLGARWKWSRKKVQTFLNLLEKEQQITQRKSRTLTMITINNYDDFQEKERQTAQQKSNRRTTEEQQKNINKNEKNEKNEKNRVEEKSPTGIVEKESFELSVSRKLAEFLEKDQKRTIDNQKIELWSKDIKLLIEKDLSNRDTIEEDVSKVLQTIINESGTSFCPEVQSGRSFREKFIQIEAFNNRKKANNEHSIKGGKPSINNQHDAIIREIEEGKYLTA